MANFNYTTRDFSTIREELGRRARTSLPEWSDSDPSDFMNVLIDLWAYMGDVQHFYIDRAAREAFVSTATQRESLLALANLYDYTPTGVAAARVDVTVFNQNTVTSGSAPIVIPAGTTFSGSVSGNTLSFYSASTVEVSPGQTATVVTYEGDQYTLEPVVSSTGTSTSNGSSGQRFVLPFTSVDLSTVRVYVYEGEGGTAREWTRVPRLVNMAASDSVYTTNVLADGTVFIQFGNGINGRIPPVGIEIAASFSTCSGAAGNVPENTVNSVTATNLTGITVLSSSRGAGGFDAESSESLRTSIPRAFRAQERAVTLSDFADIALGVTGVAKARATYATGASTGGSVTIYASGYQPGYESLAASITTLTIPQNLRNSVYDAVTPVMMLGVAGVTVPGVLALTNVYITMTLQVRPAYIQERVEAAVRDAIANVFTFENMDFGQTMTVGDIYRAVLAVEGVDYVVITGFNTTDTNTLANGGVITASNSSLLKKGAVSITASGGVTL